MTDLDREFWLIILTSWTMIEIDNLDGYAQSVERTRVDWV